MEARLSVVTEVPMCMGLQLSMCLKRLGLPLLLKGCHGSPENKHRRSNSVSNMYFLQLLQPFLCKEQWRANLNELPFCVCMMSSRYRFSSWTGVMSFGYTILQSRKDVF